MDNEDALIHSVGDRRAMAATFGNGHVLFAFLAKLLLMHSWRSMSSQTLFLKVEV
jgi:hypothetical protein